MKVVIFLDFDGVLHAMPSWQHEVFEHLPVLVDVLRQFPELEVVISSSWREHHSLDALKEFFPEDIQHLVVGVTPILGNGAASNPAERQREIEAWLQASRPAGTSWVAIDDWAAGFEPNCPNLLLTQSKRGFQATEAEVLKAMIKTRMSER